MTTTMTSLVPQIITTDFDGQYGQYGQKNADEKLTGLVIMAGVKLGSVSRDSFILLVAAGDSR